MEDKNLFFSKTGGNFPLESAQFMKGEEEVSWEAGDEGNPILMWPSYRPFSFFLSFLQPFFPPSATFLLRIYRTKGAKKEV